MLPHNIQRILGVDTLEISFRIQAFTIHLSSINTSQAADRSPHNSSEVTTLHLRNGRLTQHECTNRQVLLRNPRCPSRCPKARYQKRLQETCAALPPGQEPRRLERQSTVPRGQLHPQPYQLAANVFQSTRRSKRLTKPSPRTTNGPNTTSPQVSHHQADQHGHGESPLTGPAIHTRQTHPSGPSSSAP